MRTETRHSIVLLAGTGVTAALGLVYAVYVGRLLGPADYADFTTAISFAFFCFVALGPINGTVARFSAQYASQGAYGKIRTLAREFTRRVALYGLVGIAVGIILLGPLARLLHFDSRLPLVVTFGMIYLTLLLSVARGVFRGVQDFGKYNANILLEAASRLVLGVMLLGLSSTATSGVAAYLLALAVVVAISPFQLRGVWSDARPQRVEGAEIIRFTLPMFVMVFAFAGFQNIDMLLVKRFFLPVEAGQWGAAFTLARALGVLVTPFTILLLPLLTTLQEQKRRIGPTFARLCGYFLILAAGPLLLFAIWPGVTVNLLFGEEFADAAALLLPLGMARLVMFLNYLMALAFASGGRFRFLYVYLPGLACEVAALLAWHDSLETVATVLLVTQAGVFLALATLFTARLRHQQPRQDPIDNSAS